MAGTNMTPRTVAKPNCRPKQIWAIPYGSFIRPLLPYTGDDNRSYDVFNGCQLYYHDRILVNDLRWLDGCSGTLSSKACFWNSKKSFDIPHPTKDGHRLRHVCLEGPEADVYIKGKLTDGNVIKLPEYWPKLVDLDTINVTLTPIGVYQELFVEAVQWGTRIIVKNNLGGPINCYYQIMAERIDVEKNIPEYEGLTPMAYPGDNSGSTINEGLIFDGEYNS
jgi:hypothetical protein